MAVRRPAVTVIQEFIGLVPALATFTLPSVSVGAAYQLVDDDLLGTYTGSQQVYAYASLLAGAQVDLEELDPADPFPATKKPIQVFTRQAEVLIVPSAGTGEASGTTFTDVTASIFENVLPGDLIRIVENLLQSIVGAQTNGVTTDSVGSRNILTAGVASQFADVEVDDIVTVTGGTNTNTGAFNVIEKIDDDNVRVDADINDGGGASVDVAYSIDGDRGEDNQGDFRVKTVTDNNTLEAESNFPENEGLLTYTIVREVAEIEIARVPSHPANGFLADANAITLPATLTTNIGGNDFEIINGNVEADYRALRNDLAANVVEYATLSDVQAFFGIDALTPQNPLAFALTLMLQNTVTPVNGLGLDENAVSDEVLSNLNAQDVLTTTEMYAIAPLTQNTAVHQTYKSHVEGLSQPEQRKERVSMMNRLLIATEELKAEATTSDVVTGSRTIVSTQSDGEHDGGDLNRLLDNTVDQFLNVRPGDIVTIVSGTGVTPGEFVVDTVVDNNNIDTVTDFVSGGAGTDVVYFITRPDGLAFDGISFFDRDATYITDGVSAGHFINITAASNSLAIGRFKVTSVLSEQEFLVEQVNGIVSAVTTVVYSVDRDLTKTEQAEALAGFSSSFGSRRVVNVWPDILETPVGQSIEDLPGFYGGSVIAALTTGLPTQQGFTNLSISGFLGFQHSTGYFSEVQLDTIASGGTMILGQDGPEQPLFVRHQLTTDTSAIKFQEYSVTKNVDFIAKFMRDAFKGFIGQFNIVDTTLDELRQTAKAVLDFLQNDTRLPRIGGVIRSGVLKLIEEDPNQIDTVNMRFKLDIPIPLNNLDITIEV